jgi:guanylate kinase
MRDAGEKAAMDLSVEPGPNRTRRGLLIVLSSPSGAGKSTISRMLLSADPEVTMSISATTRPIRPGEQQDRDYHFVSEAEFDRLIAAGEFVEWAPVFDYCYGTPKAPVKAALKAGRDILFDIDWQGTQQLREARSDMVSVFILPPSMAELERRLARRAEDSAAEVRKRLAHVAGDVTHYAEYDYVLINSDLEESVARVRQILAAERLKTHRQIGLSEFVNQFRTTL